MSDRRNADEAAVIKGAQTIDLQEEGSPGVLLLHGFGDTPQTLSRLAKRLHKAGYGVLVPLLPGHGRTLRDFKRSRAEEWIDAARSALIEMREKSPAVNVVGLSMGGALAVLVAAEARDISSLILIAPYVGMPRLLRFAASTHWLWGRFAGEINARSPRSIHDPIEREKNLAYGAVTGRSLFELLKVMRRARKTLPRVTAPTLIVQSREDPRVAPEVAEFALDKIGTKEKQLVWTEGAGHIITVDYGRERVFSEVEKWLRTHNSRGATAGAR
ncbi:MAG TPA: alpha/beta fold hydrolase [Gemmatimonadaceae bacterium]|nr:alpha/beta fold hydrolase [Gemmatimonadaceae bacterium]